jgi:hypothetical protein
MASEMRVLSLLLAAVGFAGCAPVAPALTSSTPAPPPPVASVAPPIPTPSTTTTPPARPPIIPAPAPCPPNFTFAASPATISVEQGASGKITVTTTVLSGFSGTIVLSASSVPSGATVQFSPTTIAAPGAGTSVATISIAATMAAKTYVITLAGAVPGTAHSTPIGLTVTVKPPIPPPPSSIVKVISTFDKALFQCFDDATGKAIACGASPIVNNAWRHLCYDQNGTSEGTRAWASDLRMSGKATRPPFLLAFIPDGPGLDTGTVFEMGLAAYIPNGVTLDSWTSPSPATPGTIDACRGGDFGVTLHRYAGTTETNVVFLYQQGCKASFCDAHGFYVSGPKILMDDGKPWTSHPNTIKELNSYLATNPTIDGCKAYPCK